MKSAPLSVSEKSLLDIRYFDGSARTIKTHAAFPPWEVSESLRGSSACSSSLCLLCILIPAHAMPLFASCLCLRGAPVFGVPD